jgi:hypothetical protein
MKLKVKAVIGGYDRFYDDFAPYILDPDEELKDFEQIGANGFTGTLDIFRIIAYMFPSGTEAIVVVDYLKYEHELCEAIHSAIWNELCHIPYSDTVFEPLAIMTPEMCTDYELPEEMIAAIQHYRSL